jgi:hypothetical protein
MALSETLFSMRCIQPVEVSGILGLRRGCCVGGAMKQSWRAVSLDSVSDGGCGQRDEAILARFLWITLLRL